MAQNTLTVAQPGVVDEPYSTAPDRVTSGSWLALLVSGLGMGFDAYVINLPVILLPFVAAAYHVGVAQIAAVQSLFLAGYFFGTIGFNTLADILGRRITLGVSIVGYSISTLATAFMPTVPLFAAARTLTGVLAGGEQGVGAIYACEAWPDKWRGFGTANMFTIYPLGVMLTVAAGILIVPRWGFQGAFGFTLLMGILIFLLRMWIFESSRFLKVIEERAKGEGASAKVVIKDLIALKPLRRAWVSLLVINIADNFQYHGSSVIGLIFLRQVFHLQTNAFFSILLLLYGLQFFQCLIGAYLIDIIGRRPVGIACYICAGVGLPVLGHVTSLPMAVAVMALSWNMFLGPGWGTKMALNPEVFPTEARGSGMALTHGLGRISGIIAPSLEAYLLVHFGPGNALTVFAIVAVVGIIGYLMAPELRGKPIPDLLATVSKG